MCIPFDVTCFITTHLSRFIVRYHFSYSVKSVSKSEGNVSCKLLNIEAHERRAGDINNGIEQADTGCDVTQWSRASL